MMALLLWRTVPVAANPSQDVQGKTVQANPTQDKADNDESSKGERGKKKKQPQMLPKQVMAHGALRQARGAKPRYEGKTIQAFRHEYKTENKTHKNNQTEQKQRCQYKTGQAITR